MGVSGGLLGLVLLALWVVSFVDVLLTPETQTRHLPKLAWVFIVLLLFALGSVLWFVAGRPWDRTGVPDGRVPVGSARPRRRTATSGRPTNPDDDDEFLATLSLRAEEQRRARERREDGDETA